jgi:hypothetical protein
MKLKNQAKFLTKSFKGPKSLKDQKEKKIITHRTFTLQAK